MDTFERVEREFEKKVREQEKDKPLKRKNLNLGAQEFPENASPRIVDVDCLQNGVSEGRFVCAYCGSIFDPKRNWAKFCTSTCRKKAHLESKMEKLYRERSRH